MNKRQNILTISGNSFLGLEERYPDVITALSTIQSGSVAGFVVSKSEIWLRPFTPNDVLAGIQNSSKEQVEVQYSKLVLSSPIEYRKIDSSTSVGIQRPFSDSANINVSMEYEFLERLEFRSRLLYLLRESVFEFGYQSEADTYLSEMIDRHNVLVREWVEELFLEHFHSPRIISGLLRTMAHMEKDKIYPQGLTMAIAAMRNDNVEIKECGIRCFENWDDPACLSILRSISIPEIPWLDRYLKEVIEYLENIEKEEYAG